MSVRCDSHHEAQVCSYGAVAATATYLVSVLQSMPPGILLVELLQVDECVSTAAAEPPAEMGSIKP